VSVYAILVSVPVDRFSRYLVPTLYQYRITHLRDKNMELARSCEYCKSHILGLKNDGILKKGNLLGG
jgi:hypothetical protein